LKGGVYCVRKQELFFSCLKFPNSSINSCPETSLKIVSKHIAVRLIEQLQRNFSENQTIGYLLVAKKVEFPGLQEQVETFMDMQGHSVECRRMQQIKGNKGKYR
jgi:hypothetical protein